MAKTNKPTIENEKWYGLLEIARTGLFPWCKDIKTIGNIVRRDKMDGDVLKTVITGVGKQSRYRIQGKNLAEFIKGVEQGRYQLN